jgi:hypothetical protein
MPSEKFKVNKTDRSIRHAAKNFFGTFSVSPNGLHSTTTTTTISYPLGKIIVPFGLLLHFDEYEH